jgi:hypothetical protein
MCKVTNMKINENLEKKNEKLVIIKVKCIKCTKNEGQNNVYH